MGQPVGIWGEDVTTNVEYQQKVSSDGEAYTRNPLTATVSTSVTRPANTTAYADGDLLANSVTASSVTPLTFTSAIRAAGKGAVLKQVRIRKSATAIAANADFTLHLFDVDPTGSDPANGDNGAISLTAVIDNHIASIAVTMAATIHTDGAIGFAVVDVPIVLASGTTLYGLIEVDAAYTPASAEVFTVELDLVQE